jgi:hypothetical protein
VKKAASLYDASLLEVDNESQDKPAGEEGEFMIIGQHSFYRKMCLSVIVSVVIIFYSKCC